MQAKWHWPVRLRLAALTLISLAATVLAGCAGSGLVAGDKIADGEKPGRELSGRLVVTGSSTLAPLVAEIGRRFEQRHPGVRIDVQTGGSSRGIRDVRTRAADIGMVSRALQPSEWDLSVFTIARDGVCPIVHRDNPVASLTRQQLVAIYTGQVRNWKQLGGRDAPIVVVNKASGRATLQVLLDYLQLREDQLRADIVIGDNQEGIQTVATNRQAIGYVSLGAAEYEQQNGVPIRLLAVSGVEATTAELASGRFPISRPLNLVTRGAPAELAGEFIQFCQSEQVDDLIRKFYFVPIER